MNRDAGPPGTTFSELVGEEFGLIATAGFLRDPLWWTAAFVGLIVAGGLGLSLPAQTAAALPQGILHWLSVTLWQPAVEEIAFRGLLQGQLRKRRWARSRRTGISPANFLTSLAFTAMHFIHHPPLWATAVFAPSLLFGWLRERHRNTWSPIAMHVLFNLEFLCAAWWAAH